MPAFRDFSITNKLRILVMVISIIALLMACGLLGAREIINFRQSLAHELTLLSKIIADRTTASLVFGDPVVAEETLASLKAKESIISAYIFENSGNEFARYYREGIISQDIPKIPETGGWEFTPNALHIFSPILLDGEKIGTIFIKSDLDELYSLLWHCLGYISIVFFSTILIVFFVLSKLKRFISRPILDLAKTAGSIALNMDYSTRVTKKGNDEIGFLADTFNIMLDQIEQRDAELIKSKTRAESSAKKARDLARQTYQANSRLEKRVEERTAKLKTINQKLLAAKEAADKAANAKSEFLANMGHEIRTPMNGVISAAELALSEDKPLKVKYYLKIIHSSGNALLGIINDILDFSKIDAGMLKLDLHPFKLDIILNNIIAIFSSAAAKKNIELLFDIAPDMPMDLVGDSLRLQQILTNLLGNAVKFTEHKGIILIKLTAEQKSPGTIMLNCSITDSGIGMTRDQRDLLFESFTQGDSSTTRKFGGTGLGLSISQQLVELMNGQIYVESHIGTGSKFTFTAQFERQPEQPAKDLFLNKNLKKLNILIVDDRAESRKILAQMINSFGFFSETADSGISAINLLKEFQQKEKSVDLAIIDMKMPNMDGLTTAIEIRNHLHLHLPVILMSDAIANIDLPDDETMPIAGLIAKPIIASSLFNSIVDVLEDTSVKTGKPLPETIARMNKEKSPQSLNGLKVLVVEDNRVNQEITAEVLKSAGIDPCIAVDGIEAVKAVFNEHFDAVLMDIQMPNMDGYEATKKIRENKKFQSLPIIAMTASILASDEHKCLKAGMNGFVPKPIRQDKLFETLRQFVRPGIKTSWAGETFEKTSRPADDTRASFVIDLPPEKLPGLHIRQATQDLKIDYGTYKKILSRFFNRNVLTINRMRTAASQKKWLQLQFLTHNIKGSSANIGAVGTKNAAHQIEQFCQNIKLNMKQNIKTEKNGISNLNRLIDEFEIQLNQVFSSIKKLVQAKEISRNDETSNKMDPSKITPIMSDLLDALYNADPEKIRICLSRIKKLNKGALMDHVITKINEYEYESAIEALIKAADTMDRTLYREQKTNEER